MGAQSFVPALQNMILWTFSIGMGVTVLSIIKREFTVCKIGLGMAGASMVVALFGYLIEIAP